MAIGIKFTEYHLLNDEVGQQVKKQMIKKYDNKISIEENEKLIIIKIGTTFDTNDMLWVQEGTIMKKGDIYYVDLSPVVGNEVGGLRMCQIVEVYAEENLVRVRPIMAIDLQTNSRVFSKIHERTVSTKRIKDFVKST